MLAAGESMCSLVVVWHCVQGRTAWGETALALAIWPWHAPELQRINKLPVIGFKAG